MTFKNQDTPEMLNAVKKGKYQFLISLTLSVVLLVMFMAGDENKRNLNNLPLFLIYIWLAFNVVYITSFRHKFFLFGFANLCLFGVIVIIGSIYVIFIDKNFIIGISLVSIAVFIFALAYFGEYKPLIKVMP